MNVRCDLGALNELLFEQLERLMNDDLTGDQLQQEIARSAAVRSVATTVIENGRLVLDARKHADEYDVQNVKMLGAGE